MENNININTGAFGKIHVIHKDKDGNVIKDYGEMHNLITNTGLINYLYFYTYHSYYSKITISVGSGSGEPSEADTELFNKELTSVPYGTKISSSLNRSNVFPIYDVTKAMYPSKNINVYGGGMVITKSLCFSEQEIAAIDKVHPKGWSVVGFMHKSKFSIDITKNVNLTEFGLYEDATLYTHGMFKNSNGENLTITCIQGEQLDIYYSLYVIYPHEFPIQTFKLKTVENLATPDTFTEKEYEMFIQFAIADEYIAGYSRYIYIKTKVDSSIYTYDSNYCGIFDISNDTASTLIIDDFNTYKIKSDAKDSDGNVVRLTTADITSEDSIKDTSLAMPNADIEQRRLLSNIISTHTHPNTLENAFGKLYLSEESACNIFGFCIGTDANNYFFRYMTHNGAPISNRLQLFVFIREKGTNKILTKPEGYRLMLPLPTITFSNFIVPNA